MIASVRGEVLEVALDHVVIEAAGVGYRVNATPATLATLRQGTEARLITAMIVREDSMTLYGFPDGETRDLFLTLAHATIHLATAPKSNAVTTALAAAMNDIKAGKAGLVPAHLRDGHYSGAAALGNAQGYKYSHDDPDGVVAQQYPPDELVDVDYYRPTGRGGEREIAGRLDRLRAIIRKKRG